MSYVAKVTAGGSTHKVGSALYGTCSVNANVAQKDVTLADFDKLETGVTVHVKFTNKNTADNATLKVGSTTAKPIICWGSNPVGKDVKTGWLDGSVVSFTYDGTSWIMNDYIPDTDVNTDTQVQQNKSTGNNNYPILVSHDTATEWGSEASITSTSLLSTDVCVNPSTGNLSATKFNNYTLAGACEKSVDTSIGSSSSSNLPTTDAVKTYVASIVTGAAAFQGSLGLSASNPDYTQATLEASSYIKGWYWVVIDASTYVGKNCGVGDLVYATKDKGASYSASDFTVVQNEMDSITNAEIDSILADE